MRTAKTIKLSASALAFVSILAACGTTNPPAELVNARATYERASKGPANQYKPDELHVAKDSLDTAERAFQNDGDSQKTKDLAYAAAMRAETAEADARTQIALKDKAEAERQAQSSMKHELQQTKQQLASQSQALQSERQKREEAEKKAAQAAADLARIAAVKQESRGMVITLSGAVLFGSGQAALLPGAMMKLNEVADALLKGNPESKIVVEGHTDSQGSASLNQDLSVRRAQSVRDYLVSRGIAADRITAQGIGPSRPVAPNNTAEGRADNRRVEIVVQPAPGASP
jgi:outer membrane protein OmpA-like peptidoglycan-associated protein